MTSSKVVDDIIALNAERNAAMFAPFNPITGEGSIGLRSPVNISDFAIPVQWLPQDMLHIPLIRHLAKAGSIERFIIDVLHDDPSEANRTAVSRSLIRLRFKHDFAFWAASLVKIKNKQAGEDVLFRLYYPQRILVSRFEECRRAGRPIRLILANGAARLPRSSIWRGCSSSIARASIRLSSLTKVQHRTKSRICSTV